MPVLTLLKKFYQPQASSAFTRWARRALFSSLAGLAGYQVGWLAADPTSEQHLKPFVSWAHVYRQIGCSSKPALVFMLRPLNWVDIGFRHEFVAVSEQYHDRADFYVMPLGIHLEEGQVIAPEQKRPNCWVRCVRAGPGEADVEQMWEAGSRHGLIQFMRRMKILDQEHPLQRVGLLSNID